MGGRGGGATSNKATARAGAVSRTLLSPASENGMTESKLNALDLKLSQAFGSWAKNLTPQELDFLKMYQTTSFTTNNTLRDVESGKYPSMLVTKSIRERVDGITAALNKAHMPEEVTVYRGISNKTLTEAEVQTMVKQKNFYDGGFLSTSISPEVAKEFIQSGDAGTGKYGYGLKITVPKGANAAYITSATHNHSYGEYEVLLQRNSRFQVTGYSLENINDAAPYLGKTWMIHARYVGSRQSKLQ